MTGTVIVGQVLLDRYRVDQYMASGGMATVFRVWDLHRNVPLAMKVLNADLAEDPSMLKRFRREAQAMKKLVHPNIVPFYGLEQIGETFVLLEHYIDGPNLKDILQKAPGHIFSIDETLIYLKALCAALGYAHAYDVVHCDIKPGNVMVDRGGNIYLTDFGIARHADSSTTTMAGAGTAAYMAPEQIREEIVTPATDVYALGVMLFEMLAGRRPFQGDASGSGKSGKSTGERLRNEHLNLMPPDPREFQPEIPEKLAQVILKALNKAPQDRYPSAMEFFDGVCDAVGSSASAVVARVETKTEIFQTTPAIETAIPIPQSSFKPRLWVWLSIAAGVIGVALFAMAMNGAYSPLASQPSPTILQPTPVLAIAASQPPSITQTASPMPVPTDTQSPTVPPTATNLPVETKQNAIDQAAMVAIPAGSFEMGIFPNEGPYFWGAEAPRHKVILNSFWIYRTEVTNSMFSECVKAKACPKPAIHSSDNPLDYFTNPEYADYPVVNVTWEAAQAYCVWAKADLPTEAQWEKAARGDDQRLFPWGNGDPDGSRANFCDINCSFNQGTTLNDGFVQTSPVGQYPQGASPYGVLDMAGNITEWVYDRFDAGYYQSSPEKNPQGPASGDKRVVRGGSWYDPIEGLRTVARNYYQPVRTFTYLGFRCAVTNP